MIRPVLRRFGAVSVSLALAWPQGLVLGSWAAESPAVIMEGLSVGDDTVTIKLSSAAQYNGFVTANPPRLVVDLFDTENQVGAKEVSGKGRFLVRVRPAQFQRSPRMISRIVMDLKEMTSYRLTQSGEGLIVQLAGGAAAASPAKVKVKRKPQRKAAAQAAPGAAVMAAASVSTAPAGAQDSGAAPKVIPVAAVTAAAPVVANEPKLMPKAPNLAPASAQQAVAAASPELAAMAATGKAVDAAEPASPPASSPAASQNEEDARRPAVMAKRVSRADIVSRLPRDLVTMDFDNTDMRDVFKLLAAKAKINIIYGSDLAGVPPLTLHLVDVPFHEAMQTILSMTGLVTNQVGDNIMRVLTPVQLAKERSVATTLTKVVPLNYSKAADMLSEITAVRTAEGRAGAASADVKTNSLILTESPEGMATTERLIAELDVRPKQVLIETKLVEVTLTNTLAYGIQWDYTSFDSGKIGGKQGVNSVGTPLGLNSPFNTPLDSNQLQTNVTSAGGVGGTGKGTGVNLPAASAFGALTLGRITNNYLLNMTLTAAATAGKVKVLSDPKVATLNNQTANINVTTQYPYVTTTANGVVSQQNVTYLPVGIQLSVTPSINADGRITLTVNPVVSQPSATAASNAATGAPGVDSRAANTTVLVRDGETIVIGGLIHDSFSETNGKIPILGDIPLLGMLFRNKSVQRTRSELLIFVTPRILAD